VLVRIIDRLLSRSGFLLPAYLALALFLGVLSYASLLELTGAVVGWMPAPAESPGLTRVERWASTGEIKRRGTGPAVQAWVARQDRKPAIPIAAIRETEGLAEASSDSSVWPEAAGVSATLPHPPGTTYRTVCVRLCDGAYYPVSFATTYDRLSADETACAASCGSAVRLYFYRNPGEGPGDMIDQTGRSYSNLSTAFQFRSRYDADCSCKAHPWERESQDRHRLYSLEHEAALVPSARVQEINREIAEVRERLESLKRQSISEPAPRPPVYAAAAPAILNDAVAAAPPPAAAGTAVAALDVSRSDPPAAPKPEPRVEPIDASGDPAALAAEDAPDTTAAPAMRESVKKPAKARLDSARKSKPRRDGVARLKRRQRFVARSRPVIVRRWAARTAADEIMLNLLRGSL
jgi:hypothetical protein